MHLTVCDLNPAFIHAVQAAFGDGWMLGEYEWVCGDLLALRPGFDAAVSPANSFGRMDGGIDLAYSRKWGWGVQARLQAEIARRPMGELLVGEAIVIPTGDADIPHMISAPTMRLPRPIAYADDVYLASKAAFLAARDQGFARIVMPGMGTLTGRVPFPTAAGAMAQAYRSVFP